MTDEEFKAALKAHELWQIGQGGARADFSRQDLSGRDMSGLNLSLALMTGVNLTGDSLIGTNLAGAVMPHAELYKCDLTRANLCGADLSDADLEGADLTDACLGWTNLVRANLSKARLACFLRGARLSEANLGGGEWGFHLPIPVVYDIDFEVLSLWKKGGVDLAKELGEEAARSAFVGWTILAAGLPGKTLMNEVGAETAAALIYAFSGACPIPDFTLEDESAYWYLLGRPRSI